MDEGAGARYERNRNEVKKLSRATLIYGLLAVVCGVGAGLTNGIWRWVLIGLLALFAAVTGWMLVFVKFIGRVVQQTRPD